jgi:hypothetical protein
MESLHTLPKFCYGIVPLFVFELELCLFLLFLMSLTVIPEVDTFALSEEQILKKELPLLFL